MPSDDRAPLPILRSPNPQAHESQLDREAGQYCMEVTLTSLGAYECEVPPKSIADCRKMTNEIVVSVQRGVNNTIRSFGTWDGKSYIDSYFCNGEHAKLFGYVMARAGKQTTDHEEAVRKRTMEQKGEVA
jgi:hypothetical protein